MVQQCIFNSRQFIRLLIDSIPHPVIYYSPEGIIRMCNNCFEKRTGKSKQELTGTSVYRYFRREEVPFHVQQDMDIIQGRGAVTCEKNVFPGEAVFMVSKNLISDNQDHPAGILAVFTDVTTLKIAHEEVVNTKKAELVSCTLKVMHLNEMNTSLITDLEHVNPHTTKEGQELIQQMAHKYRMSLNEKIWNELESRFEEAFDTFYRALLEKFPGLTFNERKLCALVRSGLSSKDIALLTFQNPQSVDVARYRLRKKLQLKQEENLTDFLLLIDK